MFDKEPTQWLLADMLAQTPLNWQLADCKHSGCDDQMSRQVPAAALMTACCSVWLVVVKRCGQG
jgi:hypothetical protein